MNTVPVNNQEQQLIYKQIGESINDMFFFPPTEVVWKNAPVLLLIPGGGWQRNTSISMYNMAKPTAEALRAKGFAVATVSYRGQQADGVSMREIVTDIFDAMGYLSHYSEVLKIDPHRIYTMGHSAGAHLSLMAAYDDPCGINGQKRIYTDPFTVKGVAAISAPTILPFDNRELYTPIDIKPIFAEETRAEYDRFSPFYMVRPNLPPTYLAAGDKDDLVTTIHSDILYKALTHVGVPCRFTLCKGGDHCCMPAQGESASIPDLAYVLDEAAQFILQCENQ
ncbi:MAG: alpha/beta hydrolase [Clostridia bacterium]|nr:alpha/beta hydrolase [Clostridia bacterium]